MTDFCHEKRGDETVWQENHVRNRGLSFSPMTLLNNSFFLSEETPFVVLCVHIHLDESGCLFWRNGRLNFLLFYFLFLLCLEDSGSISICNLLTFLCLSWEETGTDDDESIEGGVGGGGWGGKTSHSKVIDWGTPLMVREVNLPSSCTVTVSTPFSWTLFIPSCDEWMVCCHRNPEEKTYIVHMKKRNRQ